MPHRTKWTPTKASLRNLMESLTRLVCRAMRRSTQNRCHSCSPATRTETTSSLMRMRCCCPRQSAFKPLRTRECRTWSSATSKIIRRRARSTAPTRKRLSMWSRRRNLPACLNWRTLRRQGMSSRRMRLAAKAECTQRATSPATILSCTTRFSTPATCSRTQSSMTTAAPSKT